MTLDDAKDMIRRGVEFGVMFTCVDRAMRDELRSWYVRNSSVPNLAARHSSRVDPSEACDKCGGAMVRTGACATCSDCGTSSGCG